MTDVKTLEPFKMGPKLELIEFRRNHDKGRHHPNYSKTYTRVGVFNLQDVLPFVHFGSMYDSPPPIRTYICNGVKYNVKMGSKRYRLFAIEGVKCVKCGIEGKFFALESLKHWEKDLTDVPIRFHFNLYAINEKGEEILMTKDHILPRALKGKDNMSNLQVMCEYCNHAKGSKKEHVISKVKSKIIKMRLPAILERLLNYK